MGTNKKAVAVDPEAWKKMGETLPPETSIDDLAKIGLDEGKKDSRPVIERQQPQSSEKNGEKKG